ncbi:MAG: alanyl-tRNA editing protein [Anaerolineales bacterium]|nr:alanyl-tRNA editing protein [Anaerolineales bacterium]
MTILLYQTDSYSRSFDAIITKLADDDNGIILDQTMFYPGGGGQPPDSGKITIENKDYTVKCVRRQGMNVIHVLADYVPCLEINKPIMAEIDWERRYQLMRTHTAMHILCGVIFRDYGASVTGGSMDPLKGRMDFEFETMQKELVHTIEAAVNVEVENARFIKVAVLPREEAFQIPDLIRTKINLLPEGIKQVRTVEIEGLDLQADGGTHVNNTSEVGQIRIVNYKSKGKINKRIYIELDG